VSTVSYTFNLTLQLAQNKRQKKPKAEKTLASVSWSESKEPAILFARTSPTGTERRRDQSHKFGKMPAMCPGVQTKTASQPLTHFHPP
jgi:hypothetical protein